MHTLSYAFQDLAPVPSCPDWLVSGVADVSWYVEAGSIVWHVGAIAVETGLVLELSASEIEDITPAASPVTILVRRGGDAGRIHRLLCDRIAAVHGDFIIDECAEEADLDGMPLYGHAAMVREHAPVVI